MTTYQSEQRLRVFEKELKMILNPNIRKFAEEAIKTFPDYFFEVGASSTSYSKGNVVSSVYYGIMQKGKL